MIIHSALLHHNDTGQWLSLRHPVAVLSTHDPRRVTSLMSEVEARVESENLTAVGFVTYEAGFEDLIRGLSVHADSEMPLVCSLGCSRQGRSWPHREVSEQGQSSGSGDLPRAPKPIETQSSRYAILTRRRQRVSNQSHHAIAGRGK